MVRSANRPVYGPLAAIILVRLILCLVFLHDPVLWHDEAYSLYDIQKSIPAMWGADWLLEPTPPLYYTFLKLWAGVFGAGEAAARTFSLATSILTIPVVYGLGAVLDGRRTGLIAALVYGVLPTPAEYALEIRAYSLLSLIAALALWAAAVVLRDALRGRQPRLAAFGACVVLLTYCHGTGVVIAGTIASCLWIALAVVNPYGRRLWRRFLVFGALVGAAIVPQLAAMVQVLSHNRPTLSGLTPLSPDLIVLTARQLLLGDFSHGPGVPAPAALLIYLAAAGLAALVAVAAWKAPRTPGFLALGVGTPAAGLALFAVASLWQPILAARTLLWVLVPVSVVLAAWLARRTDAGAARTARPAYAALAAAVVAAVAFSAWDLSRRETKRPWAGMVGQLAAQLDRPAAIVSLGTENHCLIDHYGDGPIRQAPAYTLDLGAAQKHGWEQRVDLSCNRKPAIGLPALTRLLDEGYAVWLLAWTDQQASDLGAVTRTIGPVALVASQIVSPGNGTSLKLVRAVPRPADALERSIASPVARSEPPCGGADPVAAAAGRTATARRSC